MEAAIQGYAPALFMSVPSLGKVSLQTDRRVERRHRTLRNQCYLPSPDQTKLAFRQSEKVFAVQHDLACDASRSPGQQTEQRKNKRALARAAGSDEPQHFSASEFETNVCQSGLTCVSG